jgi:hypothetical protein
MEDLLGMKACSFCSKKLALLEDLFRLWLGSVSIWLLWWLEAFCSEKRAVLGEAIKLI